jgi:hypothetical protein
MAGRFQFILIGTDSTTTVRFAGAAGGLFVLASIVNLLWTLLIPNSELSRHLGAIGIWAAVVALVGLTTAHAYTNGGLVIYWGLAVGPLLLGTLTVTSIGVFSEPSLLELIRLALGGALLYGLPLGTIGFLLGMVARSLLQ